MAAFDPVTGVLRIFWATPKPERPRCGARCRDGHACRAPAVWDHRRDRPRNGRCRMHGGLSTGPKTPEGRQRIVAANYRRWHPQEGEQTHGPE